LRKNGKQNYSSPLVIARIISGLQYYLLIIIYIFFRLFFNNCFGLNSLLITGEIQLGFPSGSPSVQETL
jgi:hypothetical protein